jgi:chitinase
MSRSTFARAAVAVGILASTVSAAFDNSSKKNVAMYWGQGSGQAPLSELCANPNVDIVNIAFVNEFPKQRGDYPKTNHGKSSVLRIVFVN